MSKTPKDLLYTVDNLICLLEELKEEERIKAINTALLLLDSELRLYNNAP